MTDAPRPYRSELRDDHARITRRRVVSAGGELFVERGYAATTIDAIAEHAGVSRRTVFTSVGGKSAVLKLAFDWTLAGDDEQVPIADRPEMVQVRRTKDPAALLAGWMAINAAINRRLSALYRVLVVAADADAEAAALLATTNDQRAEGAREIIAQLVDLGGLKPDLEPGPAMAIADALIDPSIYQRLVEVHGLTFDAYVEHLQLMATSSLLV
ncbi:MAG: TetR/AcrR family transcriptional regulator [Acidimicrobiales bacterium]